MTIGAKLVENVEVCVGTIGECRLEGAFGPIALPDFQPVPRSGNIPIRTYRLELLRQSTELQALYFRRYDDAATIHVNGKLVHSDGAVDIDRPQTWNRPVFVDLPAEQSDKRTFEIEISGYPHRGTAFLPFYVGDRTALRPLFETRYWITVVMAQTGLMLMPIFAAALGLLWLRQGRQAFFGWISMSLFLGTAVSAHYGLSSIPIGYRFWETLWNFSVSLYVFTLTRFVADFLKIPFRNRDLIQIAIVFVCFFASPFVPSYVFMSAFGVLHVFDALWSFFLLSDLHRNRSRMRKTDFYLIYFLLVFTLSVALHDFGPLFIELNLAPTHFGHLLPISTLLLSFWLLLSQLMVNADGFENLSKTLQLQVEERGKELDASYRRIADFERQAALSAERHRIMLDLHDGVGGHLTNMMAYMDNHEMKHPALQESVQTAIRELSGAIDSLEGDQDPMSVLAMLRGRYEPVLESQGIKLIWEVDGEPTLDPPGPEGNLNLVRLCQEALSNILKHAHANRVSIKVTDDMLSISDNGIGLQKETPKDKRTGHGLSSMRERATRIGATFDMSTTPQGTRIRLSWPR